MYVVSFQTLGKCLENINETWRMWKTWKKLVWLTDPKDAHHHRVKKAGTLLTCYQRRNRVIVIFFNRSNNFYILFAASKKLRVTVITRMTSTQSICRTRFLLSWIPSRKNSEIQGRYQNIKTLSKQEKSPQRRLRIPKLHGALLWHLNQIPVFRATAVITAKGKITYFIIYR